jgi:dTDP-4-amino-4,6-dideoxygalactose transaminase
MNERPTLPYGHQSLDEADIEAVVAVLRSDWLTTGPVVGAFEEAIAAAAGMEFAVAVSSGTAALHSGYAAYGIGPRTSIVTSPLTFAATATAALHLGAAVRFADVSPSTGNLDPLAVTGAIAGDTRLVVPTDYAGHPADYRALAALARERELGLMADAAHSLGARLDGRPATALADAAALSFHPVKAITTAEGGAFVAHRESLASAAKRFRHHGIVRLQKPYYEIRAPGLNYRLPDVLCALGLSQLGKLDRFLDRRRAIAERYSASFDAIETLEIPAVEEGCAPAWHLYVLRVREPARRDAMFSALTDAGLGVQVHYSPVHRHPLFEDLGYRAGDFPVAEDFAARAISIPLFPAMRDCDVDRVIESVHAAARDAL